MKQELRKRAIEIRKQLDLTNISLNICQNIKNMPEFIKSENIGFFYPKDIEINLLPLTNCKNKNFYLPKVIENSMKFCKYESENQLTIGSFKILEPLSNVECNHLDLIITPALMVDNNGFRLGWGGGFYDRYLQNFEGITICPIPDCLIIDNLSPETHDISCNFIVSEKQIIKLNTL